jgi:hypothetical protein
VKACFVCASTGICGHREPELVDWYIGRLEAMEAVLARAEQKTAETTRKPIAIAPRGGNAVSAKA